MKEKESEQNFCALNVFFLIIFFLNIIFFYTFANGKVVSQKTNQFNVIEGMRPPTSHAFFPLKLLKLLTPNQRVNMAVPLALNNIRIYQGFKGNIRKSSTSCKKADVETGISHTQTYNWIKTMIRTGDVNLRSRSKDIQRLAKGTMMLFELNSTLYLVGYVKEN